jgi:3-deoxy-D-manno-octulosonic-acid transferase
MYWVYSLLLFVSLLVSLPYWLVQMARHGKYRAGLRQRLGAVPESLLQNGAQPLIWVHAVSVGEVLAATGVVQGLRRRFPNFRVVISTTTETGQKLARERFGENDVYYFPLDFGFAIRPYLRALRPKLVILAETEFWPNFLRLSHISGARIAVINGRISDRSLPGYRRFRRWLAPVLTDIDLFLTQTEEDRNRLVEIGAEPRRVQVTGNLKFDVPPPAPTPLVQTLKSAFQQQGIGPVVVCGSTVDGEEALLLRAFENVLASHPQAVMILAPRHPERFASVADLLQHMGIRFWRRSLWSGEPLGGSVLLLDTIGELASVYGVADIAFVGGSLVPRGGHNIIEPAQYGVAIMVGNHTENFRDIISLFQSRRAICIVGPAEFPLLLMDLVSSEQQRRELGRNAAETLKLQTGATERTLEALQPLLKGSGADIPLNA